MVSQVECGSFGLLILTFFLSFVFLYFWSEAQNDYNDFDWFNFGNLGFWFPWSLVLLIVAAALFTYIALLLVLAVCLLSEGQRLYLHWSHKSGIVVTLGSPSQPPPSSLTSGAKNGRLSSSLCR
uniref:glycerophosphodiester phosphodiesterase domain-containing protein 5-like n=1 Tax=Maylandia zebra TaxID=106582 RepID=UPI000D316DA6|nr:glycerophosphodiester phosphodiesterase domain-containing protein 5-like [Maylandia zebra]